MKITRKSRLSAEVSTSSFSDIMFFLMLFFLIISTVVNPSVIKIMLPKSAASQALNKQTLSLTVTADKRYYLNNTESTSATLEADLRKAIASIPEPTIVLRADNSLTIQDLVDVMQLGVKLKVRMVLSTSSQTN
ncbi:MAG: biopolymer transporter ExbD [Cytophagales bacterium]|nr:biopolymer transporter ExbD [Cytophagales bacterium]